DQQRGPRYAGAVVEEVVGRGDRVAVILVKSAVEFVGSTTRDERDLRARAPAHVSVSVHGSRAEFLYRIQSHAERRAECGAGRLVVIVYAIQCDICLIWLSPVH